GQREPAAGIAGAGDEAGADRSRLAGEPDRFDRGLRRGDAVFRHARDQKVLPDREAQFAVAEFGSDLAEPAHLLGGNLAHRKDDADPAKTRLLLRMDADMGEAVEGRSWFKGLLRNAGEFAAESVFHRREEFFESPGVEHVFEPRLGA